MKEGGGGGGGRSQQLARAAGMSSSAEGRPLMEGKDIGSVGVLTLEEGLPWPRPPSPVHNKAEQVHVQPRKLIILKVCLKCGAFN